MLNTAMLYELSVLKMQAEPLLQQVPENCEEFAAAYRLLKFLKYFKGIPYNNLPPTSLLREFLGGSSFHYLVLVFFASLWHNIALRQGNILPW